MGVIRGRASTPFPVSRNGSIDMRIKYEVSAGGLVLRPRESGFDALLIGRGSPRIWTLPKGHVEAREKHLALKERKVLQRKGFRWWAREVSNL